ncbi:MAG: GUN4 domain-containing protein [Cyanobacteria bacterium J06626_18]
MPLPKPTTTTKTLVKFVPSGLGLFLTASFAKAGELWPAITTAFLTGLTTLWIRFIDGVMQQAEQYAEEKGNKFANFIFATIDLIGAKFRRWFTQTWWQLTAKFERKYYERLAYKCRNFKTEGFAADSPQAMKLKDVYVKVRISERVMSQVSPNLLKRLATRGQETHPDRFIGDFLALLKKGPDFRRLVILGAPGSGKTTLMRYLSLMYANQTPEALHPKAPQFIPVLLYLREEYPKILNNPVLLENFLPQWVAELQKSSLLKTPPDWFAKQLRDQRCLILLDGMDEVADESDRRRIRDWIDEQMYEYPETPFILTSRPAGYKEKAELKQDAVVLEVEPLDSDQIRQFIRNWYLAVETKKQGGKVDLGVSDDAAQQAGRLIAEIEANPDLGELASNPLLLTMIAALQQHRTTLPGSRVELYREMCQVLLEKRQRAKFGTYDGLSANQKQSILQPLALALTQQNTLKFTAAEVRSLLTEQLATLPDSSQTPEMFLEQLRDVDALIAKDEENTFEFAHRSFQEYLAATEIRDTQQEAILIEVLKNPEEKLEWWENTLKLYAPQAEVSNLITAVLENPTLKTLEVAITCWQLGRAHPHVKQALLDKLAKPLAVLDEPLLAIAQQKQPTYFRLAYLLSVGQWRDADLETYVLMLQVGDRDRKGYFASQDLLAFPCDDLHIIDQLWVKYSEEKFGFSVQKRIYEEECGAELDGEYPGDKIWNDFCQRVGWKDDVGSYNSTDQLLADPQISPAGEFPLANLILKFLPPANFRVLDGVVNLWNFLPSAFFFSRIQTCEL